MRKHLKLINSKTMDSLRNEDSRQRARILICIAYTESTTIGHIIKRAANYTSEVMIMALMIHGRSSVLVLLLLAIQKTTSTVYFISSPAVILWNTRHCIRNNSCNFVELWTNGVWCQ